MKPKIAALEKTSISHGGNPELVGLPAAQLPAAEAFHAFMMQEVLLADDCDMLMSASLPAPPAERSARSSISDESLQHLLNSCGVDQAQASFMVPVITPAFAVADPTAASAASASAVNVAPTTAFLGNPAVRVIDSPATCQGSAPAPAGRVGTANDQSGQHGSGQVITSTAHVSLENQVAGGANFAVDGAVSCVNLAWLTSQLPPHCQLQHVLNHGSGLVGMLYAQPSTAVPSGLLWGAAAWDGSSFRYSQLYGTAQEAAALCCSVLQLIHSAACTGQSS